MNESGERDRCSGGLAAEAGRLGEDGDAGRGLSGADAMMLKGAEGRLS